MTAQIFDSHAHYDDKKFDHDRDQLLARLPEDGVCGVVNCGSDLHSSAVSAEMAARYGYIWAAVGVHPHDASKWDARSPDALEKLAAKPKVVAIGEIGLDYHYDFSPRDKQKEALLAQLQLAKELNLPVILHDREAHGDMYDILRKFAPLKGVMHCFSGSAELARESVSMGMHIGLGGAVTFKNAKTPLEVAAAIPLDRLLLETDAPYMAPVPHRSERCDSRMIPLAAAKIAELRGLTPEEILITARENAERLFCILSPYM